MGTAFYISFIAQLLQKWKILQLINSIVKNAFDALDARVG